MWPWRDFEHVHMAWQSCFFFAAHWLTTSYEGPTSEICSVLNRSVFLVILFDFTFSSLALTRPFTSRHILIQLFFLNVVLNCRNLCFIPKELVLVHQWKTAGFVSALLTWALECDTGHGWRRWTVHWRSVGSFPAETAWRCYGHPTCYNEDSDCRVGMPPSKGLVRPCRLSRLDDYVTA